MTTLDLFSDSRAKIKKMFQEYIPGVIFSGKSIKVDSQTYDYGEEAKRRVAMKAGLVTRK